MTSKRIAIIGTGFRPQGTPEPPAEIAAIVGTGFSAELIEIPNGVFPANPEARVVCDQQYYQAGLQAQTDQFDAVYINTLGDYGLRQLRAELNIPVVGSGETAMRMAAVFGNFAIITIWPQSLDFLWRRVLDDAGVAQSLVSVTRLSTDADLATLSEEHNFVTEMRSCSLNMLEKIEQARDEAEQQHGAAAVILGCTCMAPAASALGQHPTIRTLDPMTLGYRLVEYCLQHNLAPESLDYTRVDQLGEIS